MPVHGPWCLRHLLDIPAPQMALCETDKRPTHSMQN